MDKIKARENWMIKKNKIKKKMNKMLHQSI
jgi:hypothetical protein